MYSRTELVPGTVGKKLKLVLKHDVPIDLRGLMSEQ